MCFKPLTMYRDRFGGTTFSPKEPTLCKKFQVPCGQCVACRLKKSADWAARIQHESMQYPHNVFLTLTYDDKNLPDDLSIHVEHFQDFMKKLRKYAANHFPKVFNEETNEFDNHKIRFFHCGEYGETTNRPHYHACIFNIDFEDKELYSEKGGNKLYTSKKLESLWKHGFVTIGSLTKQSAGYTARYIMKKINGDLAEEHYKRVDHLTGELHQVKPEYVTMSRMPGIGSQFYDEFKNDIFPSDFIAHEGKKIPIPKYYDRKLEAECPTLLEELKENRQLKAAKRASDNTPERLAVRETCMKARLTQLKRAL